MALEYYWLKNAKILVGQVPKNLDDMRRLGSLGVSHVISLLETDYELEPQWAKTMRMGYERHSIQDMDVPTNEQLKNILARIDAVLAEGKCVYVHCFMGQGRAGTIASCFLVKEGMTPADAIAKVRELRRGSVQTEAQVQMVEMFAKELQADQ